MQTKRFCHFCSNPLEHKYLEGRTRMYCTACRQPIYENPIPATCVVVTSPASQILLVKRNVAPKSGWWCLPGGFMELGETPEQAALRELREETGIQSRIERLLGVCSDKSPQYDTVLMVGYFAGHTNDPPSPGDDAEEVRWFAFTDIPPIAFSSHTFFIEKALKPMSMDYRISTAE
jgi:ADP-ribose pyrophosphatase YjhB (NUDIX family)